MIALDVCADLPESSYPLATRDDLETTCALVVEAGARASAQVADVRSLDAQRAALDSGLRELGRDAPDIVVANAGALLFPADVTDPEAAFRASVDLLLTGAWNTIQVAKGPMIEAGRGGSIILTSSSAALAGFWGGDPGGDAYTAAKAGLVGLMRPYANLLGSHSIRVNTIHPGGVLSGMTLNEAFAVHIAEASANPISGRRNVLPVDILQPADIAGAVLWLASDDARYITGVALPVDAGFVNS